MLPSADTTFNYDSIPAEKAASARAAAERIRGRWSLAHESIAAIGDELARQKKALGHGNYMQWVDSEFQFGVTTAHKFIKIAERFGTNFQNPENLSFEALAMLAAPSTPEPVRTEVIERAASGEKVTAKEIDALKKKLAKAKEQAEEVTGKLRAQEARASIAVKQRDEAQNRAMYAESDADRLKDEIARLQEEGTIHVIKSNPAPLQPERIEPRPAGNPAKDKWFAQIEVARIAFETVLNRGEPEWREEYVVGKGMPQVFAPFTTAT